ncbi:hypothetical protein FA13DRAFT_1725307 [Coprinellus micaceus]|uniref:Uncharacterized protein n=1 Tax=Coprinellus micaceus TaxID=71717 RepID=A0A4Y7U0K3_COPMI|nr:hypothetical protein FA13DRAFT_1725307 [Coprinellus micaceus]
MTGGLFSSSHTTGHSGFTGGVSNFVSAIFGIIASLVQSVLALFQAFIARFAIATHFLAMIADVFSGVVGFIAGNFLAIAVCIAGYFAWTTYQRRNGGRRPIANKPRAKAH